MKMPERPSAQNRDFPLPESPTCPFCGGNDTHLESAFGSVLSVAQYYCRNCRTVFEWIKRTGGADAGGADPDASA